MLYVGYFVEGRCRRVVGGGFGEVGEGVLGEGMGVWVVVMMSFYESFDEVLVGIV